ncbi:MAG TPA: DnaJ domain-containing protein [Clostridiaceae bacterium]|jgi:hypothetical protein|nr:DnaJ domain-containing protein [Clostridiaceae bacterium]
MIDELKRKLRQLKKFEHKLRFENFEPSGHKKYIWNDFFSTKDENDSTVKYNLSKLLRMNRQEIREVFDEYFCNVYFQYYKENGIIEKSIYDPKLLSSLGLPPDATISSIKSRFRELAKIHHPDHGGDSSKFIELFETYKKLMDGR